MSRNYVIGHSSAHACNCIGPQDGQPKCPCMMRNVIVKEGRYHEVRDLGPIAQIWPPRETREQEIERLRKRIAELEAKS